MQKRKSSILSIVTVGSLALAAVAITASSGTSPTAKHAALASQAESSPSVNLDNCLILYAGYPPGGCVAQLQTELNTTLGLNLSVDGIFGSTTKDAVEEFQREHNIVPADGIVGPETKAALDNPGSGSAGTPAGQLNPGQQITSGTQIASPDGRFVLQMQSDGNLVLRAPGNIPVADTHTAGHDGTIAVMQTDGNFVLRAPGNIPIWASGTDGHPGTVLQVQDDGGVVLYAPGHQVLHVIFPARPSSGTSAPISAAPSATVPAPTPVATTPANAQAPAVDHYQVQLATWIPQASVTGPQPDSKCFGYIGTLATYNGNNHVGFDGGYKVTVTYDFTYDGSQWADVAVNAQYGPTYADDGICKYHGQATAAAGVSPTTGGVKMWVRSKNPLVGVAPPIIANIDLSFSGTDQMIIVDHSNRFPSHGFRVWKNGQVIATAVDYDVSCETVTGYLGAVNIGKQLETGAKVVTHQLDLRVADQNYFGACGKPAPAPFSYPAPGN